MLGVAIVAASPLRAAERNTYRVIPLVSDQPGLAPNTDPNLVNAWGLTSGPTTPWWVSDNGSNKSTLYRGIDGQPRALVVNVPNKPTGTVFNPTTSFVLPTGGKATVYLDGKQDRVIDVYPDEDQAKFGEDVWHAFGLKNGSHSVRLVVSGEPGPGSKGNDISIEDLVVFR